MPNGNIQEFYMQTAINLANLSYAERRKVGCLIVNKGRILSMGYNGTVNGFDNSCEHVYFDERKGNTTKGITTVTKSEVVHAEMNALAKIAQSTESSNSADLYCTLSPCVECAKMIIQSGIKAVYYLEEYKNVEGIELLKRAGLICVKF